MKPDDLKNELRNLKFTHLTESELAAYCDQQSDRVARARAEAHLKQCFICERQLAVLREESAALSNREISNEDVELVERLMRLTQSPSGGGFAEIEKAVPLQERLAEYLQQMVANWRVSFMKGATRNAAQDKELWQWQSEDGQLQGRAVMEKNADLTIHFSSNEIDLEGTRLNVRMGQVSQEITLQRVSESEVYAKVSVPWRKRQGDMSDITIEIV